MNTPGVIRFPRRLKKLTEEAKDLDELIGVVRSPEEYIGKVELHAIDLSEEERLELYRRHIKLPGRYVYFNEGEKEKVAAYFSRKVKELEIKDKD